MCAFLNSSGGVLLIGVEDNGNVIGIERDGFENLDDFQKHFANLIRNKVGLEFSTWISAHLIPVDGKHVFHVQCRPSHKAAFVMLRKDKGEQFFVRIGSQTELIEGNKLGEYIAAHFGGALGRLPIDRG